MKDSFIINEIKFNINTDSYNLFLEQKKEVDKFVNRKEVKFNEEVILNYTDNKKLFEQLKEIFESSKDIEQIDTFKGEVHYRFNGQKYDVFFKDNGEYFAFVINENEIMIVKNPEMDTHEFPFRIVREVLVRKMEDKGYIFTHATGFNVGGRGYCVIASSGGGKTTLMTKMLENSKNSKVLSNDRIFLKEENGFLKMRAFPIPIVYAMGTVKGSEKLKNNFKLNNRTQKEFNVELEQAKDNQKLEFDLTEIEKVFDCSLVTEDKVDVIIVPKILKSEGDFARATMMNVEDSEKILQNNSFTPFDTESERKQWIYCRKSAIEELNQNKQILIDFQLKMPIVYVEYSIDAKPETILQAIENAIEDENNICLGD